MAVDLGVARRKRGTYDANLILRASTAAAIETVGADSAAPDYESSTLSLGEGVTTGEVVISNLAITLNDDNTTYARLIVLGLNEAATVQEILSEVQIGCKEKTGNTTDNATAEAPIFIPFSTEQRGAVFSKLKLAVVCGGTSISLDFTAHVTKDVSF
jgi:hypothetical protein